MAIVRIPNYHRTLRDPEEIGTCLESAGVQHQFWQPAYAVPPDAPAEEILAAYAADIEALKAHGGYVSADVIDITPDTPNLDAMLAQFAREHWHAEDEVRFIIEGSGLFFIRPRSGPVVSVETRAGDLLCVPRGTWHWFHLCPERRIRAIRLFQDPTGWKAYYTASGVDSGYAPLCLGREQTPSP